MCAWAGLAPMLSVFTNRSNRWDHGRMPALTRQEKITFGEMRASGVRGLLIYCSATGAAIRRQSAATVGRMTSGCPISSRASLARLADGKVPTFARISPGKKRPDARRFPDETRRAPTKPLARTFGMAKSGVRMIRGKNPPEHTLHTGGRFAAGIAFSFRTRFFAPSWAPTTSPRSSDVRPLFKEQRSTARRAPARAAFPEYHHGARELATAPGVCCC
jgi:hypothetical protein